MAEVKASVHQLKLSLADEEGNNTAVVLHLDGGRWAGTQITAEFVDVGHLCTVTFVMGGNKLLMITRNYTKDGDKPVAVVLHDFAPTRQPAPPTSEVNT